MIEEEAVHDGTTRDLTRRECIDSGTTAPLK